MVQSYRTRDDYLYYRHVTFSPRTKEFGPTQQKHYRHVVVSYNSRNITTKLCLFIMFMILISLAYMTCVHELFSLCFMRGIPPPQKIIEKFHRNLTKKADDDVAERLFLLSEERISLVFHLEEDRVTASTRDFVKPAYTDDKNNSFIMTPDMTTTFQVCHI